MTCSPPRRCSGAGGSEIPGDRAGGVPDVGDQARAWVVVTVADLFDVPGDADRADHQAAVAADRRGDGGLPQGQLLDLGAPAGLADLAEFGGERPPRDDRAAGEAV